MAEPWERNWQVPEAPQGAPEPWERNWQVPEPVIEYQEAMERGLRPPEFLGETKQEFESGLAGSALRTVLGVRQMLGLEGEDDATIRELIRTDATRAPGVGRAVGEVAGDVMQMAIPGSAIARVGAMGQAALTNFPKVAAALGYLTGSVGSGAGAAGTHAALQRVEEDESRLGNVAKETALAAAGGAVVQKGLEGIRKSAAARELLSEGAYLTPGMAAESPGLRLFENFMDVTPFLGRKTQELRDQAVQSLSRLAMNRARPPGTTERVTKTGHEGFQQLHKMVTDAYKRAWQGASKGDIRPVVQVAQAMAKSLPATQATALRRLVKDITTARLGGGSTKQTDDLIRAALKTPLAKKFPEYQSTLASMREEFRLTLDAATQAALREVDEAYPAYAAIRRVTGNRAQDIGEFTPRNLLQAIKAESSPTARALGTGPLQEFAGTIESVMPPKTEGVINMLRRFVAMLPAPAPLELGGKLALGQTEPQRMLRGAFRASRRYGVSPGTITAAGED